MEYVTLTHPDLPDQPIEVHSAGVYEYEASGWTLDKSIAPRQVDLGETVTDPVQDDAVPVWVGEQGPEPVTFDGDATEIPPS